MLTSHRRVHRPRSAPPPLVGPPLKSEPVPWPPEWLARLRSLWAELHRRALHTSTPDQPWLVAFGARLPCSECRAHWWQLLLQCPPEFGDRYFAWSVLAHNHVNSKLGKPAWTEAQARARWAV